MHGKPSPKKIRQALLTALPTEENLYSDRPPERRHVYVPPAHRKALRFEYTLVVGGRGVGKTFWSLALQDASVRQLLGDEIPPLALTEVHPGFSARPSPKVYPDANTFKRLLEGGHMTAYDVWRAVASRWLTTLTGEHSLQELPLSSWDLSVRWVQSHPEDLLHAFQRVNETLRREGRHALLVFDALDRAAHEWSTINTIVRDLLRFMLDLKGFSHLHGKVFLREDQLHSGVTTFPDASKILAMQVELTWQRHDLHGLLWHYLINAPGEDGHLLRAAFNQISTLELTCHEGVWELPPPARQEESLQRRLFEFLAGPWMGRDRRRGIPYTWIVNHLADARGRVSPRTFLTAVREAAEDSSQRYEDSTFPLHYESIKRGVQKASTVRVNEVAEDYPWVGTLMHPLRGLVVPCELDEIVERWFAEFNMPSTLFDAAAPSTLSGLPPEHWQEGWGGIVKDLEALGIFYKLRDGRINVPDIYRIGFGLSRRGGVRPVR